MSQDKFDNKFLDKVKTLALNHKDEPVPYGREDLYQAMMWTHGVIAALKSEGYTIEKICPNHGIETRRCGCK